MDFTIKMDKRNYNPQDMEEFSVQIAELLKLRVIRHSNSRHRSIAFIVRNHVEIKRRKAWIVINYKCLNDNTYED